MKMPGTSRASPISSVRKNRLGGRARVDALVLERLLQFAGLKHLADDVAAADELALDVKLRDGRPVGIFLDALPQLGRLQNVQAFVRNAEMVEDLHDLPGKSALRKLRRA